jgi:hypothetical protein
MAVMLKPAVLLPVCRGQVQEAQMQEERAQLNGERCKQQ